MYFSDLNDFPRQRQGNICRDRPARSSPSRQEVPGAGKSRPSPARDDVAPPDPASPAPPKRQVLPTRQRAMIEQVDENKKMTPYQGLEWGRKLARGLLIVLRDAIRVDPTPLTQRNRLHPSSGRSECRDRCYASARHDLWRGHGGDGARGGTDRRRPDRSADRCRRDATPGDAARRAAVAHVVTGPDRSSHRPAPARADAAGRPGRGTTTADRRSLGWR